MSDSCPDIAAYYDHVKGNMEKPVMTDEQIAEIKIHISSCRKCMLLFHELESAIEEGLVGPNLSEETSQRIWRNVIASMKKGGIISEERAARMVARFEQHSSQAE